MKSSVVIVLFQHQLAAWTIQATKATRVNIEGQPILPVPSTEALRVGWVDLSERLRGEGIKPEVIYWLVDQASHDVLSLPATSPAPCRCISWEWLAQRLGLEDSPLLDAKGTLEGLILPWLNAADDAGERQRMQETLALEHRSEAERLAAERLQLQQENERLRAQNAALRQVDTEYLTSFLPAFFPHVFTLLGPSDLALLNGRVEPLAIPNPYPEPSEGAVRELQKKFRNLPRALQQQIVKFIDHLPHLPELRMRTEMRELANELRG